MSTGTGMLSTHPHDFFRRFSWNEKCALLVSFAYDNDSNDHAYAQQVPLRPRDATHPVVD